MSFFTAVRFLTVFPVPPSKKDVPLMIGRSIPFFPVVGLLIGVILAGLYFVLRIVLPLPIVGAILVACLAVITGAHHLDGLIDTCDAMVAGKTTEQRLNIMSDTRVGAFGVTGICLLLLLKYASVISAVGLAPFVIFPVVSRWAVGGAILIFPSARNEGMGFAAKSSASWPGFIFATAIALLISIIVTGLIEGPVLMISLFALILCLGLCLSRLYGGLTGDCYGALIEIGEALALLLTIALATLIHHVPGYDLFKIPLLTG
ncbi:MAG: adenosylcobinamide-GDP ribazoletransferase [Chloroflexi bacterium]|nr:adenosylcobinamide-GDP ribazoletransferase [Chloroflexota bacterium]